MADTPERVSRRFRVQVPESLDPHETLYLWAPHFEQRLSVLTPGGEMLHNSISAGLHGGPIRSSSALVLLPPGIVAATGGGLTLEVRSDLNRIGTPGPVYIARWQDLSGSVHRHRLLENTVRPAMLGALLFLAAMSVGFVLLRRGDAVYYWLAGTMIPYAMVELGLITAYLPSLSRIDDQVFAVSGVGTLQLIGLLLTFKDRNPSRKIAVALFVFYLLLVAATFVMSPPALVQVSMTMVIASSLPVALFLVLYGFETGPGRRPMDIALSISLVVFVAGIVHDVLLKFGVHEAGIYVFRYVSFVMLTGIFAIVVKRQSGIADALDRSNEEMRHRLREQEAELAAYHSREAVALQTRAAETERQRITADLHDGMAGHLATIVALSERDDPAKAEISSLAKDALTDLRFVIDATSMASPDLRVTLAILRERCLQPLDGLGIELNWSMIDLPDDAYLSHEGNLHVLRILQEALNNSLRHGRPKVIDVTGRALCDGNDGTWIELVLENRGGQPHDPGRRSRGLGTDNMEKRAAALGGSVELTSRPDGAHVRVVFPAKT